eukprot:gnl/TRDRNA2_/TRDRNA2_129795_c1_seq1.p1 gnl/TRDRNA2_/TRDRNA2_129795_c1~~gnl/TRDRNA2_/TRDRNA2_129795_c1_seq1.p1  ORF type:complete len:533 (+),score=90.07 gnl/TRDRNA2_/TRDRNA2_129795_c1_seq1:52-1650(+)
MSCIIGHSELGIVGRNVSSGSYCQLQRSSSLSGRRSDKSSSGYRTSTTRTGSVQPTAARAAASLVLNVKTEANSGPPPEVVRVQVTTSFHVRVRMTVPGAVPESPALPDICLPGAMSTALYVASGEVSDSFGSIEIEGFEATPFSLGGWASFVGNRGRRRHLLLQAPHWDWSGGGDKPSDGKAAEIDLLGSTFGNGVPVLDIKLRPATAVELKRCLQLQALRDAQKGNDYDTLFAQVTKARSAGVEQEHIEAASEQLKQLRKQGMHVKEGCDKETLQKQMQWSQVTRRPNAENTCKPCCVSPDCACNVSEVPGEALEFLPGALQEILKGFGHDADKQLFADLVDAALGAEDGSVWTSGGKYIFSAFDRNQTINALLRMLESLGKKRCMNMILELAKHSEAKYQGDVTAVQVNFHPHGGTFHAQHRDVYSAKQRAGPNCSCSFRECVGTVCYSLGSSRICTLQTMTDELSGIVACGESCEGRTEQHWLHSGESMYFNDVWNRTHTHGIPQMEEACGPRISIAFLLGAKQPLIS